MKNYIITVIFLVAALKVNAQIPMDSLISYISLDGNAVDSTNTFNGQAYGVTPTSNRFGESGRALDFDGINDYVQLGTNYDYEKRTVNL